LGPCAPANGRVAALRKGRNVERALARWAEAPKEEQAARWTGLPPELRARAVVALVPCLVDEDGDHARALGQLAFGQPDRFVEEIIGAIEGDHWQLGDIKRGLALLLSPERAPALDLPRGYGPS